MADPQPSPDQAPSAAPGHQEEAGTQYFHSVLRSLVGMGHDLARHIHAKAIAPDPAPAPAEASAPRQPDVVPDLTIPFDRIAGCIRRTIAQALALDDPRPAPRSDAPPGTRRLRARRRILRAAEDMIVRADPPEPERLHAELLERLDAPDLAEAFEDDLATRPLDDIIAEITRDLGLGNPPNVVRGKRRTPRDIAALNARAAKADARLSSREPRASAASSVMLALGPRPPDT